LPWIGWGQIIPKDRFISVVLKNRTYKHGSLLSIGQLFEKPSEVFLSMKPFRTLIGLAVPSKLDT